MLGIKLYRNIRKISLQYGKQNCSSINNNGSSINNKITMAALNIKLIIVYRKIC